LQITSAKFAEELIAGVLKEMGATACTPPCSGGSRRAWTEAVRQALTELGKRYGYETYGWLVDFIWWSKSPERLGLVVESEWDESDEDDFQKLPVFKSPLKLWVFSSDHEQAKSMAEHYLKTLTQHVKGEEYLLIGFTRSGPHCLSFKVPADGTLERVNFSEVRLARSVSNASSVI
jgi:hypothetical protein